MRLRSQAGKFVKDTKINFNTFDSIRENIYEFGTRKATQRAWVEAGEFVIELRSQMHGSHTFTADTEADARAGGLIYLLANTFVTL